MLVLRFCAPTGDETDSERGKCALYNAVLTVSATKHKSKIRKDCNRFPLTAYIFLLPMTSISSQSVDSLDFVSSEYLVSLPNLFSQRTTTGSRDVANKDNNTSGLPCQLWLMSISSQDSKEKPRTFFSPLPLFPSPSHHNACNRLFSHIASQEL